MIEVEVRTFVYDALPLLSEVSCLWFVCCVFAWFCLWFVFLFLVCVRLSVCFNVCLFVLVVLGAARGAVEKHAVCNFVSRTTRASQGGPPCTVTVVFVVNEITLQHDVLANAQQAGLC